jgi:hypothetical protein
MKQLILAGLQALGWRNETGTNREEPRAIKLEVSEWETSDWFVGWLKLARNKGQRSGEPQQSP